MVVARARAARSLLDRRRRRARRLVGGLERDAARSAYRVIGTLSAIELDARRRQRGDRRRRGGAGRGAPDGGVRVRPAAARAAAPCAAACCGSARAAPTPCSAPAARAYRIARPRQRAGRRADLDRAGADRRAQRLRARGHDRLGPDRGRRLLRLPLIATSASGDVRGGGRLLAGPARAALDAAATCTRVVPAAAATGSTRTATAGPTRVRGLIQSPTTPRSPSRRSAAPAT